MPSQIPRKILKSQYLSTESTLIWQIQQQILLLRNSGQNYIVINIRIMESLEITLLLILIISLCIQGVSLAAMGYSIQVNNNLDILNPPPSGRPGNIQQNIGYISFIIVASGMLVLAYLALLFIRAWKKEQLTSFGFIIKISTIVLAFAVATVFSVYLKNTEMSYSFGQSQYSALRAVGVTSGQVTYLGQSQTVRSLAIAAAILEFLVCCCGGIFMVGSQMRLLLSYKVEEGDSREMVKAETPDIK